MYQMSFKFNHSGLLTAVVVLIGSGWFLLCSGNLTEEAARGNSVSNATKSLNGTISAPPVGTELVITLNETLSVITNTTSSTTTKPSLKSLEKIEEKVVNGSIPTTPLPPPASSSLRPTVNTTTTPTVNPSKNLNETISTTPVPVVVITNKTDEVTEDPRAYLDTFVAPIEIQRNFPFYHAGTDADNRPIWVIEGGKWNVRSIVEQGQEAMDIFEKFALQGFYRAEQVINASSTVELPVTEEVLIVDFEGLSLIQIAHLPTIKFLLHLAGGIRYFLLQHLHVALVVNTNAVAHTLINLVRPIFARAFEHVEIFGTNKAKWIPHVLRYCPKDQIPEWYGGDKNFRPIKVYG